MNANKRKYMDVCAINLQYLIVVVMRLFAFSFEPNK